MAARCAGCLQPIGNDEKFVLAETEVFHRACASRVSHSVTTKLRLANIELRRRIAMKQADTAEVTRLRTAIDDASRDAREVRAERDNLTRNLVRLTAKNRALEASLDSQRQRDDGTDRELERLRAEVSSLQSEVNQIVSDRDDKPSKSGVDDLDEAAQRFRLLELDPLE